MPPVKFVVDIFSHIPIIYIGHSNLHHSYCLSIVIVNGPDNGKKAQV